MNIGNNLFAIQYYGESNTGLDGEYSERPKWLDMVIVEDKDETRIKLKDKQVVLRPNDWFIYEEDIQYKKINIIEVISDEQFKQKYSL